MKCTLTDGIKDLFREDNRKLTSGNLINRSIKTNTVCMDNFRPIDFRFLRRNDFRFPVCFLIISRYPIPDTRYPIPDTQIRLPIQLTHLIKPDIPFIIRFPYNHAVEAVISEFNKIRKV